MSVEMLMSLILRALTIHEVNVFFSSADNMKYILESFGNTFIDQNLLFLVDLDSLGSNPVMSLMCSKLGGSMTIILFQNLFFLE